MLDYNQFSFLSTIAVNLKQDILHIVYIHNGLLGMKEDGSNFHLALILAHVSLQNNQCLVYLMGKDTKKRSLALKFSNAF